jgi:hypothetical protein
VLNGSEEEDKEGKEEEKQDFAETYVPYFDLDQLPDDGLTLRCIRGSLTLMTRVISMMMMITSWFRISSSGV